MSVEIVEMLGLPAAGKSWVLDHLQDFSLEGNPAKIESGVSLAKLRNIVTGALALRRSLSPLFQAIWQSELSWRKKPRQVFAMLKCSERLGRECTLQRNDRSNRRVVLDESIAQSIWALFYALPKTQITHKALQELVEELIPDGRIVIFVSCPKLRHTQRMLLRRRKSRLQSDQESGNNYAVVLGRDWMAALLRCLRARNVRLVLATN